MLAANSSAFATQAKQRTVGVQKDALEKKKERERKELYKLKQLKPDGKY